LDLLLIIILLLIIAFHEERDPKGLMIIVTGRMEMKSDWKDGNEE